MSDARPNLVLVTVDSLRADHCGFLGDDRGLTPTMDALASAGVDFQRAVAPGPQTFSSMPATLTGQPRAPTDLAAADGDERSHWERRLAAIDAHLERFPPVAERLQARGYATAAISPNPWTSQASGFDRGFDSFDDRSGETGPGPLQRALARVPGVDAGSKSLALADDLLADRSFFARWRDYYDDLLATVETLSEPYFLWVFLLDTHFPFLPSWRDRREQSTLGCYASLFRAEAAMRGRAETTPSDRTLASLQRSYRDSVRSVDAFLRRLHDDLSDADAADPALVVHADHGESFGEHGGFGHHHRRVHEENVHVPLFVHDAGLRATVAQPTSLASVPDILCSVADGGPVVPRAVGDDHVLASSECGRYRAVRGRQFKYVEGPDDAALYDLAADPGEQHDVAAAHPDRVAAARERLATRERHHAETDRLVAAASSVADRLRA